MTMDENAGKRSPREGGTRTRKMIQLGVAAAAATVTWIVTHDPNLTVAVSSLVLSITDAPDDRSTPRRR
jgi:hypothetical protein